MDNNKIDTQEFLTNESLLRSAENAKALANEILLEINKRKIKLFDLPAHKRIFLFVLTRALKTFSAIEVLCRNGFGQDVAALVRSLIENLITARYIVNDPATADDLAKRFVGYKWVIFRRSLAEEEYALRQAPAAQRAEFIEKKKLILDHIAEFKKNYQIKSDRALLTWSGKTLKDMARAVSKDLLHEYESTFRQCSRFSHPTVLGDSEYMVQDEKRLTFSPVPSAVGVVINYSIAQKYFIRLLRVVNDLYDLNFDDKLNAVKAEFFLAEKEALAPKPSSSSLSQRHANIREVQICFETE